MRKLFILFFWSLAGCEGYELGDSLFGPRWDLSKRIYVEISDSMPKYQLVQSATHQAITQAGGTVTEDPNSDQRLRIVDTDDGPCPIPYKLAYTITPVDGVIHLCRTNLINIPYTQSSLTDVLFHELGHELANRGYHIGGDDLALRYADCKSHAVMSSSTDCHPGVTAYTDEDIHYICDPGNTINGICPP